MRCPMLHHRDLIRHVLLVHGARLVERVNCSVVLNFTFVALSELGSLVGAEALLPVTTAKESIQVSGVECVAP